jgi:hypothetical protein
MLSPKYRRFVLLTHRIYAHGTADCVFSHNLYVGKCRSGDVAAHFECVMLFGTYRRQRHASER